jgi:hypothetical protein
MKNGCHSLVADAAVDARQWKCARVRKRRFPPYEDSYWIVATDASAASRRTGNMRLVGTEQVPRPPHLTSYQLHRHRSIHPRPAAACLTLSAAALRAPRSLNVACGEYRAPQSGRNLHHGHISLRIIVECFLWPTNRASAWRFLTSAAAEPCSMRSRKELCICMDLRAAMEEVCRQPNRAQEIPVDGQWPDGTECAIA